MKAERCIITYVKTDVFRPCLAEVWTHRGKTYPVFRKSVMEQAQQSLHARVVLCIERVGGIGREYLKAIEPIPNDDAEQP